MYTKEIAYRDYTIEFDYKYLDYPEGLYLTLWTAYSGSTEALIPCRVESEFIESQLIDWLDKEFSVNGTNYQQDYVAYLAEKKYDSDKENL